jgi:GNAT acetyltransferase-like protein
MSYPIRLPGPGGIVLRDFRIEDADDAMRVVGDDAVTQWLSFDSRDRAQTRALLAGAIARAQAEPKTEYYLAVARAEDDRTIGFARLALGGVQAAKLGYAIRADEWGKGYATTAARTLTAFAFERLRLHRVSAATVPGNDGDGDRRAGDGVGGEGPQPPACPRGRYTSRCGGTAGPWRLRLLGTHTCCPTGTCSRPGWR